MRFAIDVALVSKEGCVLKVCPDVQPWRIAGAWGAFAVIELAAGALEQTTRVQPISGHRDLKNSFTAKRFD